MCRGLYIFFFLNYSRKDGGYSMLLKSIKFSVDRNPAVFGKKHQPRSACIYISNTRSLENIKNMQQNSYIHDHSCIFSDFNLEVCTKLHSLVTFFIIFQLYQVLIKVLFSRVFVITCYFHCILNTIIYLKVCLMIIQYYLFEGLFNDYYI